MIYKTHKDIYQTVAARYGIDLDAVTLIGDFYWADISDRIKNFTNREIYVNKLGIFRFRKAASLRFMERIDLVENMMRGKNRSEESIQDYRERAAEKKRRMEILNEEWKFVMEKYYECKERKNAYRNLQEQKVDMGGVEKQSI